MALRNLLVHLDSEAAARQRGALALTLAEAHEAHLAAVIPTATPLLPSYIGAQLPRELIELQEKGARERAEATAAAFEAAAKDVGAKTEARVVSCEEPRVAEVINLHARYADMIILGQHNADEPAPGGASLVEDVVLGAGRPVMIVPYIGTRQTPGGRVMVAWDGGREAARAVQDALPLLEAAEEVVVLVIGASRHPESHGEEPGADIALHLSRHGVPTEVHRSDGANISVGEEILSRLADAGSDLLVMGGYGHSRLREVVLGGATRTILGEMTVPVLMSH